MAGVEQLPARLDLEFVAGNPFDLTVTCTGATVTSPVVTMATSGGDSYTSDPGVPTVSAATSVVSVGFSAADSSALNATTRGKTYRWSLAGTCDGEGPFELCAGTVTVRPVGSYGTSSSSTATLAVTVGGAAVSLAVTLGGSGGGGAATLDELTDVTITAAASGDILRHNGTAWVDTPGTTHFEVAGAAATAQAAAEATASAALSAHTGDTDDAHDASAISYAGGTGMSATNVETAIDELATEKADASVLSANGKGYVNHGSTASTARPSGFASIEWHGSVEPTNAVDGDTWVDTSA